MRRFLLIALVLTACGGSGATAVVSSTTDGPRVVEISLTEFAITPFAVEEGETVQFNVRNDGIIDHEFRFTAPDEGHDHETDHDADVLMLKPGESGSVTVTFDGDYTQASCLLPGHYEAGMYVDIN